MDKVTDKRQTDGQMDKVTDKQFNRWAKGQNDRKTVRHIIK